MACNGDKDSILTGSPSEPLTAANSDGGDTSGDGPITEGGPPTTTEPDPSGGSSDSSGGASPISMEVCERYLDCIAVTSPQKLPETQQGFGPNGTCWDGPPDSQEQCVLACQTALETLHMVYPDEPACGLCQQPQDCDDGKTCDAGDCVEVPESGCGDGIVQPDETCDTPFCVDECHEAPCNPFSHTGCRGDLECRFAWYDAQDGVACVEKDDTLPTDGQTCQYLPDEGIDYCAAGLACAPAELIKGCPSSGCCTRLCNIQEPDDCPNGRVCQPLDLLYYYSQYVGVCVLL